MTKLQLFVLSIITSVEEEGGSCTISYELVTQFSTILDILEFLGYNIEYLDSHNHYIISNIKENI